MTSGESPPRQTEFVIQTSGAALYDFTTEVTRWVRGGVDRNGLLTLFVRHTSCSLLIQENADPEVQGDLAAFFRRLAPPSTDPSMAYLRHTYEGPDDMPAHIKAAMLPVCLSIPVADGRPVLGTWQGIYLFEHRDAPHRRRVAAHLS
ncbi:secondary thiamine-phosphate synthase enzyme YjbQ [Sedimentitalea nanhaiensis]|uniref:Secondary thiamine-phosphate synthase enzyme n=1 Tax=Sedimentitalea nanhaiensis TaxID=999627 RepID=A0A1I6ZXF8_9RHOB|nr:secondary thiamine-phosphate synthase enzyme YjbQ [Sedimentitalea nanhaiensis]SFT67354.1 secondary thiamine-phosphate synthase enzyme [Sedimentitalea nanhaiensis]